MGKTSLAIRFLCNSHGCACCAPDRRPVVFIFDDEAEFSDALGIPAAETPEELEAAIYSGWVLFDPSKMLDDGRFEDLEAALEFFADFTIRVCDVLPGRKFFVVDELGDKVSGSSIPRHLKRIAQRGRRYGIDGVFLGQQLNELHNTVKFQLNELFLFRTGEENALKFAVSQFRFSAEELQRLPDFKWICRNKLGGESRG